MDGAFAICLVRADRRNRLCNDCAHKLGKGWIDNRGGNLANECRNHRERSTRRNRGSLCFSFRAGNNFLAQLLESEKIGMACLDSSLNFPRSRLAGEGTASSHFLLRDRFGSPLADKEL